MAYKRIETNFCISRLLLIYSYKFTNVLTITITIITITKFSNLIGYQLMMGNLTNDLTHVLSKVSCFLLKSFHFRRIQKRWVFSRTNTYISAVFRMLRNNADAHISSLDITLFRCRQAVAASLKVGSIFLFGFVIESI